MEFDISTLSPTYKLLVGIPGKSNAFQISSKLGLNSSIIDKAKSFMTSKQIDIETLLKSIYDDKALIEKEKEITTIKLEKVKSLKKDLEKDTLLLKNKQIELLNKAKMQARDILLEAKEDANNIIKELNSLKQNDNNSNLNTLNSLKNKLNDSIKNIQLENTKNLDNYNFVPLDPKEIKPNKRVFVTSLNQDGVVLSNILKSNEVKVQVGNLKMNIDIKYLAPAKKEVDSKKINSTSNIKTISKSKYIKNEINVIGLNVEEALFAIDKFLDDCILAKLKNVKIVHGKGTGILRNNIHKYLKNNSHVKSFRLGSYYEGELGVTIVELK